jgi:hypothetical protein
MAALGGKPEIGLGDALGGSLVNIALILGLALGPYQCMHFQGNDSEGPLSMCMYNAKRDNYILRPIRLYRRETDEF